MGGMSERNLQGVEFQERRGLRARAAEVFNKLRGRKDEPGVDPTKPITAESVDDLTGKMNRFGVSDAPRLVFVAEDFQMPDGTVRKRRGFVVQAKTSTGRDLEFPVTLEKPHVHHSEEVESEEEFLSAYYVTQAIYAATHRFTQIIRPGTDKDIIDMTERRRRVYQLELNGYDPLTSAGIVAVLPPPTPSA